MATTSATATAKMGTARRIDTPTPLRMTIDRGLSEVAAAGLLPLDGLEERLEVASAEPLGAFALNHLEEDGGAIGHRLAEDLQQVTVLVLVDEDAELLQLVPRKVEVAEPISYVHVVRVGNAEKADAARSQCAERLDDVVSAQRDVLHARCTVEVEVLLDLALLATVSRFVDRQ